MDREALAIGQRLARPALGQSRAYQPRDPTSAAPAEADPYARAAECQSGSCNIMGTISFDYPIGAPQQCRRDYYADRFCRFEVDREFKFDRLLDRNARWILTSQDLVHESGGTPKQCRPVRPVRHQAADFDKCANDRRRW